MAAFLTASLTLIFMRYATLFFFPLFKQEKRKKKEGGKKRKKDRHGGLFDSILDFDLHAVRNAVIHVDMRQFAQPLVLGSPRYSGVLGALGSVIALEGLLGFSLPFYPFYPFNTEYHNGLRG